MTTKPQAQRRKQLLIALGYSPQGATARHLSKGTGHHYTTTNDDLHVLMHEGKVTHDGDRPRIWKVVPIHRAGRNK